MYRVRLYVGALRLAKPEPPESWTDVKDAISHGAKCLQRIIPSDPPLTNVPFDEDCLFLDIYTPRYKNGNSLVPTMVFIHGGGYYGGSGALYNFTNVALKGVTVVSVSYRLDVFGFLSTLDETIPGNFGMLDQALALDWVKANIQAFGGKSNDITLFGGSAGAVSVSVMLVSPYTKGKFQKAIIQSGVSSDLKSVKSSHSLDIRPRQVAQQFGTALNCSLPEQNFSQDLLKCIREFKAEDLIRASVKFQKEVYNDSIIHYPVVETTFGYIPDEPLSLFKRNSDLAPVSTIYGYTRDDGSWYVSDPDNNGVTLEEFKSTLNQWVLNAYPPSEQKTVYERVLSYYLPQNPSSVAPIELRKILVQAATEFFAVTRTIREVRLFAQPAKGGKSYVYEFNHRPSYSQWPDWMGVAHADEKGFVLGLPYGPDPFKYPIHTPEDAQVADLVTTFWTNFAKFGNPTPSPVQSVTWKEFIPQSSENVMVIQTKPEQKTFSQGKILEIWSIR